MDRRIDTAHISGGRLLIHTRILPTLGLQPADARRPRRFPGPGTLYNAGNGLGLIVGLAIALARDTGSSTRAVANYFAGDSAAIALTIATLTFFVSGRTYDRAWRSAGAARSGLVRLADGISGIGAIVLGISLALVTQPALAVISATLHAVSKLGSAVTGGRRDMAARLTLRAT